jgi:hypothetical protein
MSSSDPFAHDDAAYVLGALGPAERRAFEGHLAECAACTLAVHDLAGVPGLLGRLAESAFTGPEDLPPIPETLLPQLLRSVRRLRWRTRLVAGVGVAAAGVLAVLLGVSLFGGPRPESTSAQAQEMTQVDQHRLEATVEMQQVAWGTKMHLSCTYDGDDWGEGSPVSYALVVRTGDGASQRIATWRAVPGRTVELDAATDTDRNQITTVDVVVVGTGRRVLTLSPVSS